MSKSELARPDAVLFDWDNTLVDSWGPILVALNLTFDDYGLERWTMEEAHIRVARSMRDSFPALFGDDWEGAKDRFYEHFARIHLEKVEPLKGAHDLLQALKDAGIYTAIVSNKQGAFLRAEVAHLEWGHFFGNQVGATDAPQDKPAIDPVHMALGENAAMQTGTLWFVGDSVVDIQCARNAGAVAIIVGDEVTGGADASEMAAFCPDWHFRDCEELAGVVKHLGKVL
ncbi:HAD family hydrolase [Thalassospira profundimaris]|uniref:phosphoglycolate phosphatase n=1 Tax=Thalassospira profundimaris TaxID=502049 RepID=A0A367XG37_9PROT|nr:HAD family hydrolase [Thalassospira profundimaris]RCK52644.1 HAD family hydrolase [Thalassospira profundimaris]